MKPSHTARPRAGLAAIFLASAIPLAATQVSGGGAAAAQAPNACALLSAEEVQALAPKEHVADGASRTVGALESFGCRYTWGTGTGRFTLDVTVNPASHVFAGMNADAIKRGLLSSVVPETADAAIPDVGDAAVFKASSPLYAVASAYLKDRILAVSLDGIDAAERKGELISLLKSAASRL